MSELKVLVVELVTVVDRVVDETLTTMLVLVLGSSSWNAMYCESVVLWTVSVDEVVVIVVVVEGVGMEDEVTVRVEVVIRVVVVMVIASNVSVNVVMTDTVVVYVVIV